MSSIYSQSNGSGVDCCHGNRNNHGSTTGNIILRANTGSFGPSNIPVLTTLLNPTINEPIASVTIGTDGLDNPAILVQFNGVLTTSATVATGLTYIFTLFRNCRGSGFREQLRSFSVSQATALSNLPDSRGLSFAYNQNDAGSERREWCTYTLELTRITSSVAVNLNVTVTGTLSVLAVGEED
jgi:hypothetical protein